MSRTCDNCRFWNRLSEERGIFTDAGYDEISEGTGQCRFGPPAAAQVNPFYANSGPLTSSDAACAALWPITFDEHWCGQHQPRLSAVGNEA